MKKYIISLCLIVSLFAFSGCTSKVSYVSITSKMLPYEKYSFNITKTSSGKTEETGTAVYTVSEESYSLTGEAAYKISAEIISEKNKTTILSYLTADTTKGHLYTPIYTEKEFIPAGTDIKPWKLESKYDNVAKKCAVKANFSINNKPESEDVVIPLKDVYLDNETLALTIRTIDLKLGFKGLLNVVVSQYGRIEPLKVTIGDAKERIVAPYGAYDCYKITLTANTIFAGSTNSTVCYVTDDKVVLRINQGPYLYELASYSTTK